MVSLYSTRNLCLFHAPVAHRICISLYLLWIICHRFNIFNEKKNAIIHSSCYVLLLTPSINFLFLGSVFLVFCNQTLKIKGQIWKEAQNKTIFSYGCNYPTLGRPTVFENVKWRLKKRSRYRPGVAQRVGRDTAVLFHDCGNRKGVSGQQHDPAALYPGKDAVPILREVGWTPGPLWTGGRSRPHRDSIPDLLARSQSLYRLSYRAHKTNITRNIYSTSVQSYICWEKICLIWNQFKRRSSTHSC